MTSRAIMSTDVIVNTPKGVSSKSESIVDKKDSFSRVMEKNNYENHDNQVNRHEKSDFHSSKPQVVSRKNITQVQDGQKEHSQGFLKEEFALDLEESLNDIANAYKENLDLTDEELLEVMENLAINIFQLPLKEVAKEIVLAANGENDITGILVNEHASTNLQSMNQFLDMYDTQGKLNTNIEELDKMVTEAIKNLLAEKEGVDATFVEEVNVSKNEVIDESITNVKSGLSIENEDIHDNLDIVTDNEDMKNLYKNQNEDYLKKDYLLKNNIHNEEYSIDKSQVNNLETDNIRGDLYVGHIKNANIDKLDAEFVQRGKISEVIELDNGKKINIEVVDVRDNMTNIGDNENKIQLFQQNSTSKQVSLEVDTLDIAKDITKDISQDTTQVTAEDTFIEVDDFIQDTQDIDELTDSKSVDFDKVVNKSDVHEILSEKTDNDSLGKDSKEDTHSNEQTNETFYDRFITNLEKSFGVEKGSIIKEVSHIKEMQEIVNQVVEKIKIHINKDTTTMKLNLNPEHLGRVELEVTSKSGVLTADFVVENETAKEALEKGLPALIEKFNEQGLKVEAVEVSISDYDFTRQDGERKSEKDYGQDDKRKKRHGKVSLDDLTMDTEVVQEERKIMSNMGIDYSV